MLNKKIYIFVFLALMIMLFSDRLSADAAKILIFTPQGTVKNPAQVRVKFSESMIPFGESFQLEPFIITAPYSGNGRWVDNVNWIYDFDTPLPSGVRCEFELKNKIKSLAGNKILEQKKFVFETDGPVVSNINPYQHYSRITEQQLFILTFDVEPDEQSIVDNTYFSVDGIIEKIGVNIIKSEEKLQQYKLTGKKNVIMLQAKREFPNNKKIHLVCGAGIKTINGFKTDAPQIFEYKTRPEFSVSLQCSRENANADIIPLLPITINFSEAVNSEFLEQITLKTIGGKNFISEVEYSSVTFSGPFPEDTTLILYIPKTILDIDSRLLMNIDEFPTELKIAPYPPIAKFSARFGIIELIEDKGILPVTVRNIENPLKINGLKLRVNDEEQMISELRKIAGAGRRVSILNDLKNTEKILLPKINEKKDFEVVGIPLERPGLHIVEIQSEILGKSLLDDNISFYAPTAALVTNMSVHFKWGRENSLVWVTSLDNATPVADAEITIRNSAGKLLWQGVTNSNGIAIADTELQGSYFSFDIDDENYFDRRQLTALQNISDGLFVFAKKNNDISFIHTSWNKGIEPWRYNLNIYDNFYNANIAHTIFDRPIYRAGETVNMKHIMRKHTMSVFDFVKNKELPNTMRITHYGSDENFELPLKWSKTGVSEIVWNIPRTAKLGQYSVMLINQKNENADNDYYYDNWEPGVFRVEEFRVPLLKAVIQKPQKDFINVNEVEVDAAVSYLAGGGAANAPVTVRYLLQSKYPSFEDYSDYNFSAGKVIEKIESYSYDDYDENNEVSQIANLQKIELTLDNLGTAKVKLPDISQIDSPKNLQIEMEFKDPNGEIQTVSTKIPLWNSKLLAGVKTNSWSAVKSDKIECQVIIVDINGKPAADANVKLALFQRTYYSHRIRQAGGYYSYEHTEEIKKLKDLSDGLSDSAGLFTFEFNAENEGNLIIQAEVTDDSGNKYFTNTSVWIYGEKNNWFDVSNHDRIDLIPIKKKYEHGDTAEFQIKMPFNDATVLVTAEREGVLDYYIQYISSKNPVVKIPVKKNYTPNIFVSALCARGRIDAVKPTAMLDLGKPAYKLGICEINVGWKEHELNVSVSADKKNYRPREKVKLKIKITTQDGDKPPKDAEAAISIIDEGLLELLPNNSWNLLEAMMAKRAYEVTTSTAQSQVVGKRHFGLKATPAGGGGGKQTTRELFDTLIYWKARIFFDENGEAEITFPLNDSITGFKIAVIANAGAGLFGLGQTSIKTTQELMIFSGLPSTCREGDKFKGLFTFRNTTENEINIKVDCNLNFDKTVKKLETLSEKLGAGESKEIGWDITVPHNISNITWELNAVADNGISDKLKVMQKVVESVKPRVYQSTIFQLEKDFKISAEKPENALLNKGGLNVAFSPKLSGNIQSVINYMKNYPFSCMEQKVSKALATKNMKLWESLLNDLPNYIDYNGLVKYFPNESYGYEILTAYILSTADEAGFKLPENIKNRLIVGLIRFVDGKISRNYSLPFADLTLRKLIAIEALARYGKAKSTMLDSIIIEPNLWPTSAVIDWINILLKTENIRGKDEYLKTALNVLNARIYFQGTTMNFSTEKSDFLWWLMINPDLNHIKSILTLNNFKEWKPDIPRLARAAINRLKRGTWASTTANVWGIIALDKFSKEYEAEEVDGITNSIVGKDSRNINWSDTKTARNVLFNWKKEKFDLQILHSGAGKPWVSMQSIAAIKIKAPIESGFKITKSVQPVLQKQKGKWQRGDIARIKIEIEAKTDMTWVTVTDPVPTGALILGKGLNRDSQFFTADEKKAGWTYPAFEERSQEFYRAYYDYVRKGKWMFEYTIRLNNVGVFKLPETRVEALYNSEMFGEFPNPDFVVNR